MDPPPQFPFPMGGSGFGQQVWPERIHPVQDRGETQLARIQFRLACSQAQDGADRVIGGDGRQNSSAQPQAVPTNQISNQARRNGLSIQLERIRTGESFHAPNGNHYRCRQFHRHRRKDQGVQ